MEQKTRLQSFEQLMGDWQNGFEVAKTKRSSDYPEDRLDVVRPMSKFRSLNTDEYFGSLINLGTESCEAGQSNDRQSAMGGGLTLAMSLNTEFWA
jgi:hypothetical protein